LTGADRAFTISRHLKKKGDGMQLTVLKAILLGAIQGATEFLPVSSSGHLVLAQDILGVNMEGGGLLAFDVCLHFGTLMAVLVVFRKDIVSIIGGVFGVSSGQISKDPSVEIKISRFMVLWIFIGTLPAVIAVVFLKDFFESLTTNATAAAVMLLVTGTFLWFTRFAREKSFGYASLDWWRTILIGIAQAFAIIPGISRSGATISAGMFLGLDKSTAARFSFLLAIPAIAGAMILSLGDLSALSAEILFAVTIGTIISAIVGFLCIKLLLIIIKGNRFSMFAYYCWAAGLAGIAYKIFSN
jgi:undecaprenyl-diphosphatase